MQTLDEANNKDEPVSDFIEPPQLMTTALMAVLYGRGVADSSAELNGSFHLILGF
jgi:hypothetical protein